MSSQKYLPGFWRRFFDWWKLSSQAKPTSDQLIFKGEDLNGNYYFESVDKYGRLVRIVEPKNLGTGQSDLKMLPDISMSPEWVRWLRKNRDDPPTEEEMIRNVAIMYITKVKAAELEASERKNWPELDAKLKEIEEERNYHHISLFPIYKDLEIHPGQEKANIKGFCLPDLREIVEKQQQFLGHQDSKQLTAEDTNDKPTESDNKQLTQESPSSIESNNSSKSSDCR